MQLHTKKKREEKLYLKHTFKYFIKTKKKKLIRHQNCSFCLKIFVRFRFLFRGILQFQKIVTLKWINLSFSLAYNTKQIYFLSPNISYRYRDFSCPVCKKQLFDAIVASYFIKFWLRPIKVLFFSYTRKQMNTKWKSKIYL